MESIESTRVAATPAEFRVNEQGAATWSMPIYAVPGTAGVAPNLSLAYNSSGGFGPVGKGFSIQGWSQITRCRASRESGDFRDATGAPIDGEPKAVNFDTALNSDEYCLDGQRLIHQDGTRGADGAEYRLELEAFTRVILRDRDNQHGPDYFVVQRRDGSTSYYGDYDGCAAPTAGAACSFSGLANRPDARANANNDGLSRSEGQIFGLARSYDSHGNYMDWQWTSPTPGGAVELLPGTVRYTGRANLAGMTGPIRQPYAEVRYLYEASPVLRKAYQGGSLSQLTRRLTTIQSVDASNQVVREYRLAYQATQSGNLDYQVSQITECAISGVQAICLKPTQFTWSTASYTLSGGQERTDSTWQRMIDSKLGDVDGDGRLDLVWIAWVAAPGTSSCPTLPNGQLCARVNVAFGTTDLQGNFTFSSSIATGFYRRWPGSTAAPVDYRKIPNRWALVDYDGDGRDDLMLHPDVPSSAIASTQWALYLSTGSGFADQDQLGAVSIPTQVQLSSGPATLEPNVQLSDLNGDGLVDVVYAVPVRVGNQTAAAVKVRLGTVVSAPAGSIFGPELGVAFDVESARAESCDALYVADPDDPRQPRLTDLNGDGRMDWALTYRCESFPSSASTRTQRQTVLPIHAPTVEEGEPGQIVFRPALMAGGRVEVNQYVFRHYLVGRPDSPKWRSISNTSQFADVNGDALPDLIFHHAPSNTAEVWLNTGSAQRGFVEADGLLSNIRDPQAVDIDGDGLSDLAYGIGNDQTYRWRRGTADGLGPELPIPGCQFGCLVRQVQGGQRWFADFDGDGAMEFVIVKPGDQNQNLTVVTGNPAHRHQARDVVTTFENGLGARTEIDYLPLTNRAVYRRAQFSRLDHDNNPTNDSTRFGRGSAVLDLMTPIYVVSKVSSPAPSLSDDGRRAVVHYRYAGAKLQGGGRGFLGFAEITTIDGNYTAADGTPQACPVGTSCHVMTVTRYHQDFPLIGRPRTTDQVILPQAFVPEACRGADRVKIGCATPAGTALFPDPVSAQDARRLSFSGKSYSCWGSKQAGTTSTACAPAYSGSYCPVPLSVEGLVASRSAERTPAFQASSVSQGVEVFVDGESDVNVEPNSAQVTGQRFAVHCHDAGFANLRLSEEVHLAGGFSTQHEVVRVRSTFQHANDTTKWHLGRLQQSQVLHQRKEAGQTTFVTELRKARFDYDGNSGQLKSEIAHLDAGATAELRTYYSFDASGNRIASYNCSASVPESVCRNPADTSNPMLFQPARVTQGSTTLPNALVRRYSRVEFDPTGRFPVKTWQPYFDPTVQPRQWSERVSSEVLARDRYGEVTQARDANSLLSYAARDGLGREYWTASSAGSASLKTLHWCTGRNGGVHEVSCPIGPFVFRTEVRQVAAVSGAQVGPTTWTYHDVLGRVLMTVTEAFDGNGFNKDLSAVCVDHDQNGRQTRQTEPFFLAGASPPSFSGNVCVTAQPRPGSTTMYDVTGRVKRQLDAVGAVTELWHQSVDRTFNGLAVPVAELEKRASCNQGTTGVQCSRIWKERRDAAGKLIESEDPAGTIVRYGYTAAGDIQTVSRREKSTNPVDVVTTTQFDVAGRKISQTDPDSGVWTWQYNAAGEVIRQVDGAGRVVDTERDAMGRVWRRTTEAAEPPTDQLLKDGFEGSAVLLRQINQELVDLYVYDTAVNGLGQLHWSQRQEPGLMNHQVTLGYDPLGRLVQRVTQVQGRNYTESYSFDSVGRPLKQLMEYQEPLASGAQLFSEGSETAYSVRGFAVRTCRATTLAGPPTGCISGTIYHELLETDARGAVLRERLAGNATSLTTTRSFDAVGRVDRVQTGANNSLQNWDYDFDAAGNLRRRQNLRSGHLLDESFGYDLLDRLVRVGEQPGSAATMALSYDGLGNVCSKSVASVPAIYTTGLGSGCFGETPDPTRSAHQVAEAHGWRYTYNPNGDVVQRISTGTGRGLSIEYDAHRGIRRLELVQWPGLGALEASDFRLDSADQRYQRRDFTGGTLTRITTYVGSLERIEHLTPFNGADREARLTLGSVIVTTKWSGGVRTDQQRFVLRDHLGSADVIVRPDGTVEETLSFDAHGRRRDASTYAYLLSYTDITTRRGYTGHEHLDALGLVHMNARIYDPILGRFLQADTLIEADATQGLNRYTYVLNNALTHTDPTGRSLSPMARTFLSVFATIVMPGIGATAFGLGNVGQVVFAGFVSGSISGGLKGGVIGAFSAGLFHGIGSTFTKEITPWAFTGGSMNLAGRMAKTVAHGTAGGVMQSLQGGKFGHGFVSAAAPELLHPQIGKLPGSPVRILSAALVGGAVSSATGGKFASGAVTAAFMWAFNHGGGSASGDGSPVVESKRKQTNPASVNRFFEMLYDPLSNVAAEIGVNEDFMLALSSYESGWYNDHNLGLNNPFGLTKGGGRNLKFDSVDNAIDLFKRNYGSQIQGVSTIEEFTKAMLGGPLVYNSVNPNWAVKVQEQYRTIVRRKAIWLETRSDP